MDDGICPIEDPDTAVAVRKQARRVHLVSLLSAALITAGVYLLPE